MQPERSGRNRKGRYDSYFDMDKFRALLLRTIEWAHVQPRLNVAFAEPDIAGPVRTPRQPLLEFLLVHQGTLHFRVGPLQASVPAGTLAIFNAHYGNGDQRPRSDYRYACVSLLISSNDALADIGTAPLLLRAPLQQHQVLLTYYRDVAQHASGHHHHLPHLRLKLAIMHLLMELEAHLPADPSSRHVPPPAVSQLLSLLHTNQADPNLSLASLARQLHLSHNHLGRTFLRAIGRSPHQYLTDLRIARATALLRNTELSIKQVADMVGYRDAGYFSRVYRHATGNAPSMLRRRGH